MPRGLNIYQDALRQGRLLTPEKAARLLSAKLQWWYRANDLTLDSSGLVSGARDLTGNGRHGVQATSANRLTFFKSDPMFGGRPSFGSTTSSGNRHLAAPASYNYRHQIFSCCYNGGADPTFDVYSYFSSGTGTSGSPRIMGAQYAATLITSTVYTTTVSKGGAAQSGTVLPMPATVCHGAGNSTFSLQIGGNSGTASRVLVGAFRNFIGAGSVLTAREIALAEGVIAWDDGTQDQLIATHPFRNRPPLIGD